MSRFSTCVVHSVFSLFAIVTVSLVSNPAQAIYVIGPLHSAKGDLAMRDNRTALPVVLWHGMGDACCSPWSIGKIKSTTERALGVFVYSIATGATENADVWSSYFGNVNDQVAKVCAELRSVPELTGGYNFIGFSQGGQFARAVVERCQHLGPRARKLITFGAQHQGVMNLPGCSAAPENLTATAVPLAPAWKLQNNAACAAMQTALSMGAYARWVRDHIVQAQYFKDPYRFAEYLNANIFLPDINNEKPTKNKQYKRNLASLDQLVLFQFEHDYTVVPKESSWFGFYDGHTIIPLKEQPLYQEDWLGLRELDESGRLVMAVAEGHHMQFSLDWFVDNVIWKYLAD